MVWLALVTPFQAEDEEYLSQDEEEEEEEDHEVVATLNTWRTHPRDETGVANLLRANTENLFGKMDRLDIMEKSCLQVVNNFVFGWEVKGYGDMKVGGFRPWKIGVLMLK